MSLLFAATYPERTEALVLCGSFASLQAEPLSLQPKPWARSLHELETHWGEGILVPFTAPSRSKDEAFLRWFGKLERATASPGAILALMRANYEIDVRHILSSIQAPTLVLHRIGDRLVPVTAGRYHAQLLLESPERAPLHALLETWLPQVQQLKSARAVRWSLDVDPLELF